jgi:hypothetical protein
LSIAAAAFVVAELAASAGANAFGTLPLPTQSFLYTGGTFTQIDVPGEADGINDAGQIVGSFSNSTGTHGFLDTGRTFTQIDVPGASFTAAGGINDAGQIVGVFINSTVNHGCLDTGGTFTQIDVPGGGNTQANGINNAGQIVGTFVASVRGDPHFTTYGGVHYDYQGIGDFLLTRSTSPGDQFDVQIRLTGFSNAGTAVITEAAATSPSTLAGPAQEEASFGSRCARGVLYTSQRYQRGYTAVLRHRGSGGAVAS